MAQLLKPNPNKYTLPKRNFRGSSSSCSRSCNRVKLGNKKKRLVYCLKPKSAVVDERETSSKKIRATILEEQRRRADVLVPCSSASSSSSVELVENEIDGQLGHLVTEFGWKVRRLIENEDEMREVAQVQAEAFHVPVAFFDDVFFEFFKAEVLSGLLYKLRNSPPDRYACLVAKTADTSSDTLSLSAQGLVGVVDVTVLNNKDVVQHLDGAEEYLYVSGIAVFNKFRRQKVATALLKACDVLLNIWGFRYLALRAYEDDSAACRLYTNAGYKIISKDPLWTTWIGRKRRVLMIKRSNSCMYPSNLHST
ncbi:hypothetical protein MKW98_011694 [Papaver atlanticum]|uniref:N-acetyltransferase domain-containing protein n=1 Tax=Papaver atlanticum TaxID=357466 RepID=A0AAD4S7F3_9MAGN|nr:hypothetical protein MKW98_011694 [Papaver atlanticum]